MQAICDPGSTGMLKLALRESENSLFLARAAEHLRRLSAVLRVRIDGAADQFEIIYRQPAPDLLREVHQALRQARLDTMQHPTSLTR